MYSAPHCLNFVHISKNAFIIIILIIFFVFFWSYYCYIGLVVVEFNAYSVVLRVSCRPIVYYCILLSLRSVKDEIGHVIVVLCC